MFNLRLPICPRCNETKFVTSEEEETQKCSKCDLTWNKHSNYERFGYGLTSNEMVREDARRWWKFAHRIRWWYKTL